MLKRAIAVFALLSTPAMAWDYPKSWTCGTSSVRFSPEGRAATVKMPNGTVRLPSAGAMSSHWAYDTEPEISECTDERATYPCIEALSRDGENRLVLYFGPADDKAIICTVKK